MLLREAASRGSIDVVRYLARLSRSIVAPAVLVIGVATLVGLLPLTQHAPLITGAPASLLYFEIFELIRSQLSYEAAGSDTSPFQTSGLSPCRGSSISSGP